MIVNRKELKRKCNYEILEVKEVYKHDVYSVRNCRKRTEYLVTLNPDTCSCEAFRHNSDCKHVNTVKELKEKEKEEKKKEDPEKRIAVERTAELMVLE